jgi:hypothetical protein
MKKEIEINANNLYGMNIKANVLGEPRDFTVMDFKEIISGYNDKPYLLVIRGTFTEFEQSKLYCDWRAYNIVMLEDVTEIIEHDDTFASVYSDFFKNDISNGMSFEDYMGIETALAYWGTQLIGFGRNIESIAEDGEDECLPVLRNFDTNVSGWKRVQEKSPEYTNDLNDSMPREVQMDLSGMSQVLDDMFGDCPKADNEHPDNDFPEEVEMISDDELQMSIAQDMLEMSDAVTVSEYMKRMETANITLPEYTRNDVDPDPEHIQPWDEEDADAWEEEMEDDESTGVMVDLSEYDSEEFGKCLAFACGYPIYDVDLRTFQNRN